MEITQELAQALEEDLKLLFKALASLELTNHGNCELHKELLQRSKKTIMSGKSATK